MAAIDVTPFGDGQFLIQLFPVSNIPDQIGFGRYYEATCEVALEDGNATLHECIVHRPTNRRNVVGVRLTDWLVILIKTDLTLTQLSHAAVSVAQYGRELSEQKAATRRNQV
ncbi:MAG TPA: hypothetical protein VH743_23445 [Beijerinckiaceae bacterium]|jgi:hypothetical protein